jgi:hypothetical protein
MADYTFGTEVTYRRVYSLRKPTNWAEVGKVYSAITNEMCGRPVYDDTVTVDADDENITFAYNLTADEAKALTRPIDRQGGPRACCGSRHGYPHEDGCEQS